MIIGMIVSVPLSVVSLVLLEQMQLGKNTLTIVKDMLQYCLTRFDALAMNHTSGIAATMNGKFTTVAIVKMLVLTAINIRNIQQTTGQWKLNYFMVFI